MGIESQFRKQFSELFLGRSVDPSFSLNALDKDEIGNFCITK